MVEADETLAYAVGRLPAAEFVVAFRDVAEDVLTVRRDGAVTGCAVTVRSDMALSGAPLTVAVMADEPADLAALGEQLLPMAARLGSVELLGPGDLAADLAGWLGAAGGGVASAVMRQRLWQCTRPVPPDDVPGHARPMRDDDHEAVARWLDEFSIEALRMAPRGAAAWREDLVRVDGMRVWVDQDEVVAMVLARPSTPVSHRVGPVYTPPDRRGRGYAAALTAAVTGDVLASGAARTVLLTDDENPVSNRIYPRIGYEVVGPHQSWAVRVGPGSRTSG